MKIGLRFEPWIVEWQVTQLVVFSLKRLCHWGRTTWQLKHRSADALHGQHVAVGGAVGVVADRAALDPGGAVLVEERAALVGVALQAGLLLESAEPFARGAGRGDCGRSCS